MRVVRIPNWQWENKNIGSEILFKSCLSDTSSSQWSLTWFLHFYPRIVHTQAVGAKKTSIFSAKILCKTSHWRICGIFLLSSSLTLIRRLAAQLLIQYWHLILCKGCSMVSKGGVVWGKSSGLGLSRHSSASASSWTGWTQEYGVQYELGIWFWYYSTGSLSWERQVLYHNACLLKITSSRLFHNDFSIRPCLPIREVLIKLRLDKFWDDSFVC